MKSNNGSSRMKRRKEKNISYSIPYFSPSLPLFPYISSFLNLKENTFRFGCSNQSDPFTGCNLSLCISDAGQISIFPLNRNMEEIKK